MVTLNNNLNDDSEKGTCRKLEKDSSRTVTSKDSVFHNETETDEEGLEIGEKLKEDVYSMLFLAKPFSPSFFFALFAIFFQYVILGYMMAGLLQSNSDHNPLNIPAGVTDIVAVAQAFGIILAVLSAEDLLDALAFFYIILHREIFEIVPNATPVSWFLAWFLKFLEGSTCLVLTFILVVQSEEVLTLFLNFAALSFVCDIDDLFFALAKNGFFGARVTEGALSTTVITLPKKATRRSIFIRNVSFYLILIAMLVSWAYVEYQQRTGYFLCNHILAQFGDSYEPVTSHFSGHFKFEGERLYNRVVYTNRRNTGTSTEYPFIGYCDSTNVWTLSLHNETKNGGTYDSCSEPLAWSQSTSTFDVLTVGSSWVSIRRNDVRKKFIPYSSMKLECIDCSKGMNPLRDTCSFLGQCGNDGLCECNEGTYGLSCEYDEPCSIIATEANPLNNGMGGGGGQNEISTLFESGVQLLKNDENQLVLVQEKPVYFQLFHMTEPTDPKKPPNMTGLPEQPPSEDYYYLLFFNGFRWVLSRSNKIPDLSIDTDGNIEVQLANYLSNEFHPYYSNYTGEVMSTEVPQSLPGDEFVPTSLDWYVVTQDTNLKYKEQGAVSNRFPELTSLSCKED